jgi:hypothetical protein
MSPSLRIATASRPAPSVFTDDGSGGRTLLLAWSGGVLMLVALGLALRGDVAAVVPGIAAAAIAATLFSIHRKRRLFTSATLWLLRNEDGSVRGWIESGLREVPHTGFTVSLGTTVLRVPAAAILHRGDTWIIPLEVGRGELPPGRFLVSYRIADAPREAGRFRVDSTGLGTV